MAVSRLIFLLSLITFFLLSGGKQTTATIDIQQLNQPFTGTGDLFSALFLAWMAKTDNLCTTLENTIATLQSVLKRTLQMAQSKFRMYILC